MHFVYIVRCATSALHPAMRETRVRANGHTTAAVAQSAPAGRRPGAAGVSGSVPVCGEGAGARGHG